MIPCLQCLQILPSVYHNEQIDRDAQMLLPDDCQNSFVPVSVPADGDCLLHAASYLVFGHIHYTEERRVRIVIEQILHPGMYLSSDFLKKGMNLTEKKAKALPANFAMYSDYFDPSASRRLTSAAVEKNYQTDVKSIVRPGTYLGIWQLFALASVLGINVKSVYPNRGNPNVQRDLHRTIFPKEASSTNKVIHIMWTTTRAEDMTQQHFVPNHFVPLVHKNNEENFLDQHNYLSKHVLAEYDGQYYPGIVLNEDDEDVEVKCMHRIGNNRFFWPPLDDVCWYTKDKVMCIIPEPSPVTGKHMQVDPTIWKSFERS